MTIEKTICDFCDRVITKDAGVNMGYTIAINGLGYKQNGNIDFYVNKSDVCPACMERIQKSLNDIRESKK